MNQKEKITKTKWMKVFEEETGKKSVWHGKVTKQFKRWKDKKEKNKSPFKSKYLEELGSEDYNEADAFFSRASIARHKGKGYEGLKIRTANRVSLHKYGVWVPKKSNLPNWLNWLISSIRKLVNKFWGNDIAILTEEARHYKHQAEDYKKRWLEAEDNLKKKQKEYENIELYRELAKDVSNIKNYKQCLDELKILIEESYKEDKGMELKIRDKLRNNKWLLNIDCEVQSKEEQVDIQSAIDLHIKTKFQQDKIFEFKSPNLKLFYQEKKKSRLKINKKFANAINQLIHYMRRLDLYSQIDSPGVYGVYKSEGTIIAGYNLNNKEKKLIKDWNFHLSPHIKIVTYNELLKNAITQFENLKYFRKKDH